MSLRHKFTFTAVTDCVWSEFPFGKSQRRLIRRDSLAQMAELQKECQRLAALPFEDFARLLRLEVDENYSFGIEPAGQASSSWQRWCLTSGSPR